MDDWFPSLRGSLLVWCLCPSYTLYIYLLCPHLIVVESTFCYRNISILGHVGFCRQKWSYVEDSMKCKDLSWGYHAWLAGCIHSLTKTETETPWTTSHIISLIIPQKCSWGGVQRLKLVEMSSQLQGHLLTTTAMPIILSLNKLQIGEFF